MKTRWGVKLAVGLLFLVFISFTFEGVLLAQTKGTSETKRKIIKLRCIAGHPTSAFWTYTIHTFLVPELKKQVLAQTKDYQLEIEELYGGSVAKLGEELEALESGIGDIGQVVIVFEMSKLHPHQFAWWFPFGSVDLIQVTKAANMTFERFQFLHQVLQRYNQKLLALAGSSSYHFVTRFPVQRLEDMKGKRMAHGGPMVPWLEAFGSVGVQSRLNEAYTCLQTGVYDGWAMEPNSTVGFKLYEVAPYYTTAGLGAGFPTIVTINLNAFKRLPKEVQEIVVKVGKEYENFNARATMNDHDEKIEFMRKKGTKISNISESERVRFAKAADDALVADKLAKESDKMGFQGTELARFYIKTLSQLGYKWPVVPTIK